MSILWPSPKYDLISPIIRNLTMQRPNFYESTFPHSGGWFEQK